MNRPDLDFFQAHNVVAISRNRYFFVIFRNRFDSNNTPFFCVITILLRFDCDRLNLPDDIPAYAPMCRVLICRFVADLRVTILVVAPMATSWKIVVGTKMGRL